MDGLINDNQAQSPDELVSQQQSQEQQDRLYTSKDMSEVAKRERERAYEKGKREALAEQERLRSQSESRSQQGFQANPLAQNNQMSADDIKQLLAKEAPEILQKQLAVIEHQAKTKSIVNSFVNKIDAAKEKYPELESQLTDIDFDTFAPILSLATDMENTADIMHELISNPMKMGNLLSLLHTQPKLAHKAMYEISNSIKQNQKAIQENRSAQEPFEQHRSSAHNGMDSESMSVSDFRKIFRN